MRSQSGEAPRVIVAQMGARHSYAVPRMLHARGALSRLYTDFCIHDPLGRAAVAALNKVSPARAGKLRRRTTRGIPDSMVYSDRLVNLRSALAKGSRNERYAFESRIFGAQMKRWGVGDANMVYAMYASGEPFWGFAKERGLKIAVDVYITPLQHRIVAEENEAFPDWADETSSTSPADLLIDDAVAEHALRTADLLLCPSAFVRDDVAKVAAEIGVPAPPTVVVPYGAPSLARTTATVSAPQRGRVLFAGEASVRKGIHYLAKAANILKASHQGYEFCVAGHVEDRVRNHPEAQALTFLGHLSRDRMREEFLKADVFALPTIAEGSASVTYEALSLGVPVVTTPNAGSVVVSGQDGFITPARDAEALALAIEKIVSNRPLRETMSRAAAAGAGDYGEGPWADRIFAALRLMQVPRETDPARRAVEAEA